MNPSPLKDFKRLLVVGATGYVGGRLVPRLVEAGYTVRCLARDPRKLDGRNWTGVEIARGDVLDLTSFTAAAEGCDVMYYLVHSMGSGEKTFEEQDRTGASNAARAAASAGMKRIIYLGGLGKRSTELSPHLRSRNEVGDILARGSVPVTEFRAAMIIGSGSLSFEMMHALVNRLPVMTAPKWVSTRSQPIAIRDVLRYLTDCLEIAGSVGKVIDIGGRDVLDYRSMMLRFARLLGLKRFIIVVPVLTPRLSSLWINFVTPISAAIARPLIEGLKTEAICENDIAGKLFPFTPSSFDDAATLALRNVKDFQIETRWTNASVQSSHDEEGLQDHLQMRTDVQRIAVNSPLEPLFMACSSVGGANGWYYGNLLWKVRGFIDKMAGGVGLRRGRRHPTELLPGDALDFWRVESVVPNRSIVLRAEMRVPGRAWLEFSVEPNPDGGSLLTQTARFYPRGVLGLCYWYGVYPLHALVFRGMARGIARRAEELSESIGAPTRP